MCGMYAGEPVQVTRGIYKGNFGYLLHCSLKTATVRIGGLGKTVAIRTTSIIPARKAN